MSENLKKLIQNYQFNINAIEEEKKFYDIEENKDPINYKVRNNSKHEFGIEYEQVIPLEGEVRLLGNRHRDCRYYSLGLELCKRKVIESGHYNYLPCKEAIDAMYRCYTEDKYGDEYHKTPVEEALPYTHKFFNCYFKNGNSLTNCMKHFEDSVRAIYRSPDNKLTDYY